MLGPVITETNGIRFVMVGTQNRMPRPYLAATPGTLVAAMRVPRRQFPCKPHRQMLCFFGMAFCFEKECRAILGHESLDSVLGPCAPGAAPCRIGHCVPIRHAEWDNLPAVKAILKPIGCTWSYLACRGDNWSLLVANNRILGPQARRAVQFPTGTIAPGTINVHIRRGDKWREIDLAGDQVCFSSSNTQAFLGALFSQERISGMGF
jgi:hypothetical protein